MGVPLTTQENSHPGRMKISLVVSALLSLGFAAPEAEANPSAVADANADPNADPWYYYAHRPYAYGGYYGYRPYGYRYGYGLWGRKKREAEASPEANAEAAPVADPNADPNADPWYYYAHRPYAYGGYYGYRPYGYGYGYGLWGRKKREAEAEAAPVADPTADPEA